MEANRLGKAKVALVDGEKFPLHFLHVKNIHDLIPVNIEPPGLPPQSH